MINNNTYDFIISDENEIMLILHSQDGAPENPTVYLDAEYHTVELYRNDHDAITLERVDSEVFDLLADKSSLLVCEIQPTANLEDTEITCTYDALIANN